MQVFFLFAGICAFIAALALDIRFVNQREPWRGYLFGLLPILLFGVGYIIPALTCKSDNPVGCEWAGMGVLLIGWLTILMLAVYSLLAVSLTRAYRSLLQSYPEGVSSMDSMDWLARSLAILAVLAVFAVAGGLAGWGMYHLVDTGLFVPWRSLGKPPDMDRLPGERAVAIRGYDIGGVKIATSEGRVFETRLDDCFSFQRVSQNCWFHEGMLLVPEMSSGFDSDCRNAFWIPSPPGTVLEREEAVGCMRGNQQKTGYVLLEDGTVWVWHHRIGWSNPLVVFWEVGGALSGMLIRVLIGILLEGRSNRKLQQKSST